MDATAFRFRCSISRIASNFSRIQSVVWFGNVGGRDIDLWVESADPISEFKERCRAELHGTRIDVVGSQDVPQSLAASLRWRAASGRLIHGDIVQPDPELSEIQVQETFKSHFATMCQHWLASIPVHERSLCAGSTQELEIAARYALRAACDEPKEWRAVSRASAGVVLGVALSHVANHEIEGLSSHESARFHKLLSDSVGYAVTPGTTTTEHRRHRKTSAVDRVEGETV